MFRISVDDFVRTRVLAEFQPVVEMIRILMKECAPEAIEEIAYGIPVFKMKHIMAVISPTKKDVTLSFSRGAEFEDRYGLLRGVGKISRHIKLKNLATADQEAMRYYIQQALDLDKGEAVGGATG